MGNVRHLMSPLDFSVSELETLFDLAKDIERDRNAFSHKCDGKILATLFYEPSTRTRLSFASAKPKTLPPKRSMADSKESLVLVDGS